MPHIKTQKFYISIAVVATCLALILMGLLGITATVLNLPQLGIVALCLIGAIFYLHHLFAHYNRTVRNQLLSEMHLAVEKQKRVSRHEHMNCLQVVQSYLEMDNIEAALEYIQNTAQRTSRVQQDLLLDIPELEIVLFQFLHDAKKKGVIFDLKVERISQVTWDLSLVVQLLNKLLTLLIGDEFLPISSAHRVFFNVITHFDSIEISIGAESAKHLLSVNGEKNQKLIEAHDAIQSLISRLKARHIYHQDNQVIRWSIYLPNA